MFYFGTIYILLQIFACRYIQGVSYYYVEDAYFDKLNPEYVDVDNTNLEPVWINTTASGVAINLTLIKDMPPGTTGHLNIFEKVNGEYKTPSGISVNVPWCKLTTDPLLIHDLLGAMNLTKCPVPAGRYSVDEWHPKDISRTPFLPKTYYRIAVLVKRKRTIFMQANVMLALF